jgi:hypothetical protein
VSRKSKVSPFDELFRTNPYLLSVKFTEADSPTNCVDCVDSQSSHIQEKKKDCRPSLKRKQAPVREEQCDCVDKSDDSDSSVPPACGKEKHRGKGIQLKDGQLGLQCE